MKQDIKVLVLTKYDVKGASSRLRTIQYFDFLGHENIKIEHAPLFEDSYLEKLYSGSKISKLYILKRYFQRLIQVFSAYRYDLLWIEKELFPWLPLNIEGFLSFVGIKYIVDYDDAIFHNYDASSNRLIQLLLKNKIKNVMKSARLVTVCNDYLKEYAQVAGAKRVEIIPTVVDLERYKVSIKENSELVIGWIGTIKTEKYLIELTEMFEEFAKTKKFKLYIIGGGKFHSTKIHYEIVEWSQEKESEYLQEIDIGIMPLLSSKWERGKCAYKLIQYMASAKPVVASRVGMNCEVVHEGKNGYLVESKEEWIEAFESLSSKKKREEMGKYAREQVVTNYSLQATQESRVQYIRESI